MVRLAGFVGQQSVAELGAVAVRVEQRIRQMRLLEQGSGDQTSEPAVVGVADELEDPARHRDKDLVRYPHISASRRGLARGPLDDALEAIGLTRWVVAVVPSYAMGALMALQDDVICLLPRLMTTDLTERGFGAALSRAVADLQS